MKRYFGYIRVSTQREGIHGVSLQEQKSAIETYARRNGFDIAEWFEERVSAAKRGRRVFTRMLASLNKGRAGGVVMHKIDRSARNLRDWADLAELIDRGIDVHFAHDSLDMRSRGGRLTADIQAVVAADFVRNLRDETRKGMRGRLAQGIYPWRAPLGYRDMGGGNPKSVDPVYGPLVREAFELYATGEWNFHTLPDELHRRGLRQAKGAPLSKNGLTTLLNNPFYMGLIHLRSSGETFDGRHEPIVSKALYDRVQAVLRGGRGTAGAVKRDFAFRRMIRCARCHLSLIGENIKGRYVYYRCHSDGCQGTSLKEETIRERFLSVYSLLTLDAQELRDVRDMIEEIRHDDDAERDRRRTGVELQIAKCADRLDRLTDLLIDGAIDAEAFNARKTALLSEKRGLRDRLATIAEEPSRSATLVEYLELANTAQTLFNSDDRVILRDIVGDTTSNFSAAGNEPVIALKSPFQEIVNYRKSMSGDPARDEPRKRAEMIFKILTDAGDKQIFAVRAAGEGSGSETNLV